MREKGVVTRISGGKAAIRMSEGAACSKCGLCSAVGGGHREIEVDAPPGLSAGDAVEVIVKPSARLRSSAILFLLPLVTFIAALLVSERSLEESGSREVISFLIGIGVACMTFAIIALYDKRLRGRGVDMVRVEKVDEPGA